MHVLGSHGRQRGFVLRRANASCKVLQWETWLVLEVLGEALVFRGGKGSCLCWDSALCWLGWAAQRGCGVTSLGTFRGHLVVVLGTLLGVAQREKELGQWDLKGLQPQLCCEKRGG